MTSSIGFCIPLHKKLKKVLLPPHNAWNNLVDQPSSITAGFCQVEIVDYKCLAGFAFGFASVSGWRYCVVSKKGYIVVYTRVLDRTGYAFDLASAKLMRISEKEKANSSEKNGKVKVVIKWDFGQLTLRFHGNYAPAFYALLNYAFENSFHHRPRTTKDTIEERYYLQWYDGNSNKSDSIHNNENSVYDERDSVCNKEGSIQDEAGSGVEEADESDRTVAIPYRLPYRLVIPQLPVLHISDDGDAIKVHFSISDNQVAVLRSFLSGAGGLSLNLFFSALQCNGGGDVSNS